MNAIQKPVSRLAMLAQRALADKKAGETAAVTAREGEYLGEEAVEALALQARLDPESMDVLVELMGARDELQRNPFARRSWLASIIADMAQESDPEPRKVLALLFDAIGRNAAKSMPLFSDKSRDEASRWSQKIYLPGVSWDDQSGRGAIYGGPPAIYVPTSAEDVAALRNMQMLRDKAAASLVRSLEGETLINLRRAVWLAVWLFPHASIFNKVRVEKMFDSGENGTLVRTKDKREFSYFALSDKEVLVIQKTALSERLVRQLDRLEAYADEFWSGEYDIPLAVATFMRDNHELLITPDQFQRAQPGFVAVQHTSWKESRDGDKTVNVLVLLERRLGDGAWRWMFANRDGARVLFDGRRLRYRTFSTAQLPSHIVALLRKGEHVTSCEQLGLIPEQLPRPIEDEEPAVAEAEVSVEGAEAEPQEEQPESGKKRRSKAGAKKRRRK